MADPKVCAIRYCIVIICYCQILSMRVAKAWTWWKNSTCLIKHWGELVVMNLGGWFRWLQLLVVKIDHVVLDWFTQCCPKPKFLGRPTAHPRFTTSYRRLNDVIIASCARWGWVVRVTFGWSVYQVEAQLDCGPAGEIGRGRLEIRSHVVPKTAFQDGGHQTRIFTHQMIILA